MYIIYKASGGLVHMLKGIHFCIQRRRRRIGNSSSIAGITALL